MYPIPGTIDTTTNNPSCSGTSDGSVVINSIELSAQEAEYYGNYVIDWTSNVPAANISLDRRQASSLPAGTYGYRLYAQGLLAYSEYAYFTLTDPTELRIVSVSKDNDPCESTAKINISITGGTPPYSYGYNVYGTGASSNTTVSITGIREYVDDTVTVTDNNGCTASHTANTKISFSNTTYSITSNVAPYIYDDHPQSFGISVGGDFGPYKFVFYDSVNDEKGALIAQTDFYDTSIIQSIDHTGNFFNYELSSVIYPGNYILDIIDSNNCILTTDSINIPNQDLFSANLIFSNNTAQDLVFTASTELIFDTLLFPVALLQTNSNLLNYIKNINSSSTLDITVGDKKYSQKIAFFNKETTGYGSNILNITTLSEDPQDWFFTLNIARGFNLEDDPEILTDNIKLLDGSNEYIIDQGLGSSSDFIKLVRGTILTPTSNTAQFNNNKTIGSYELADGDFSFITSCLQHNSRFFQNSYIAGGLLGINFLDHESVNNILDINSSYNLSNDQKRDALNTKSFLESINDLQKTIFVAAVNSIPYNGIISVNLVGGSTNYTYSYKKYNPDTQSLSNILYNNENVSGSNLQNLPPGAYVIKVNDEYNNKLKTVNGANYDDHYSASLNYIQNTLNVSASVLDFQYGDMLVVIGDSGDPISSEDSIPGVTEDEVFVPNDPLPETVDNEDVLVTNNNTYNNSLSIQSPTEVKCVITGPSNFTYSFTGDIKFLNLPDGVYNIDGDQLDLKQKFFYNFNHKVFMNRDLEETLTLNFVSYNNQFIVEE